MQGEAVTKGFFIKRDPQSPRRRHMQTRRRDIDRRLLPAAFIIPLPTVFSPLPPPEQFLPLPPAWSVPVMPGAALLSTRFNEEEGMGGGKW